MAEKFWRKKAILLKLEDTYGVDAGPTGALNAVLGLDVQPRPLQAQQVERTVDRPYLGARPKTLANLQSELTFKVEAAGSGVAGTAPAYDALLQACALSPTTVAATAEATIADSPPAPSGSPTGDFTYTKGDAYTGTVTRTVTLTCTNAGGSGVATFDVTAPEIEGLAAYSQSGVLMTDAMPVALPGGVTITPTVGTAFALNDAFTIRITPAGVSYTPLSDIAVMKSCTVYMNVDGILHRMTGARGTVQAMWQSPGFPTFDVRIVGLFQPAADAVLPAVDYSGFRDPETVGVQNTPHFALFGQTGLALESLEVNLANQVEGRHLVNTSKIILPDRAASGRAVIETVALATLDPTALAVAGTTGALSIVHGTGAGKIVRVDAPAVLSAHSLCGSAA